MIGNRGLKPTAIFKTSLRDGPGDTECHLRPTSSERDDCLIRPTGIACVRGFENHRGVFYKTRQKTCRYLPTHVWFPYVSDG